MSLSRMACMTGRSRVAVVFLQVARGSSSTPLVDSGKMLRPEDPDEPGFFKKIYFRFKGIPLKGEVHRPRSFMDDIDKEFFAPESLPEMPKDYKEYPERDLKNFPYPARRMYSPKARLLMFPDSWFTPFYKITGVSGPYVFFGGLWLFLVNKEIFVFDEPAHILVNWILIYLLFSRAFGYRLDKWLYGEYKKQIDEYKSLIEEDLKEAKAFRKNSAAETESLAAAKENFPVALKEAMEMQLEATYRANVQKTALEVKRRIDFLNETEAAKKRFERNYMLNWITNSVRSEIEQNRDGIKDQFLNNCIEDLKGLAARA